MNLSQSYVRVYKYFPRGKFVHESRYQLYSVISCILRSNHLKIKIHIQLITSTTSSVQTTNMETVFGGSTPGGGEDHWQERRRWSDNPDGAAPERYSGEQQEKGAQCRYVKFQVETQPSQKNP